MKKAGVLILVILAGFTVPFYTQAQVLTRDQILLQIQTLTQQIQYLQQQLNLINNGYGYTGYTNGTCYTFNYNMGLGSTGGDVSSLQNILQSEGFSISSTETASSYYGASTAAAVSAFQMKYYSEILAPYGLTYGTGRVGAATRAKLNQLSQTNCYSQNYNNNNYNNYCYGNNYFPYSTNVYPCNNNYNNYGTLTITSPTGNQTYQPGNSVYVAWSYYSPYSYSPNYVVELWGNGALITRMNTSGNSINFTLPSTLSYGSNYFFKVYDQNNQGATGTSQNFTVGYGTSYGNNITILAPNGGEQVRIGTTYPIQFSVNTATYSSRIRIELWQYGSILGVITDGLPVYQNQTQTFSWTGGSYNDVSSGATRTAAAGYGYSVRVLAYDSSGNLTASDASNSYFNLTY